MRKVLEVRSSTKRVSVRLFTAEKRGGGHNLGTQRSVPSSNNSGKFRRRIGRVDKAGQPEENPQNRQYDTKTNAFIT